jgi:hypothetical protein
LRRRCSGGFYRSFDVFGEATVAIDPGEEPFDDPSARQHDEAGLTGDFADDLDAYGRSGGDT